LILLQLLLLNQWCCSPLLLRLVVLLLLLTPCCCAPLLLLLLLLLLTQHATRTGGRPHSPETIQARATHAQSQPLQMCSDQLTMAKKPCAAALLQ
jgi:hypothetical protein